MSDREWPSREEWVTDAERAVRQGCYPRERVSNRLADWADDAERAQLAHIARGARLAAGRAARAFERDVVMNEIDLYDLHRLLRAWDEIQDRLTAAAEKATEDAVTAQVARRQTDQAWAQELGRRKQIDGDWVHVVRPTNDAGRTP